MGSSREEGRGVTEIRKSFEASTGLESARVRVCFVCLGNICRSPTAEGVFLRLVAEAGLADRIHVDSAGTAAYHAGERPDARSLAEAEARGTPLPSIARQFVQRDFGHFDYVLAMDGENLEALEALRPDRGGATLARLRAFAPDAPPDADVPDPYYGGGDGFARVYDMCEIARHGLLAHLIAEHGL